MLGRLLVRARLVTALAVCALIAASAAGGAAAMPLAPTPAMQDEAPCPHHGAAADHAAALDEAATPDEQATACGGLCCIACFPAMLVAAPAKLATTGRPPVAAALTGAGGLHLDLNDPPPRSAA